MENLYPRPSPPKPTKDGKMAGFGFARLHPWIWGDGGLLFHFILFKIVVRIIMNTNYYGFYKEKLIEVETVFKFINWIIIPLHPC